MWYEFLQLIDQKVEVRVGLPSAGGMKISYNPNRKYEPSINGLSRPFTVRYDEVYNPITGVYGSDFLRNQDVWMRKI